MTKVDAAAEIDIIWEQQRANVRIPLAGDGGQEWCRRYQALARRQNLPARAEHHPGRSWIIVELPDGAGPPEITAVLDSARDLVSETDAAEEPSPPGETDHVVRDWWASQQS